MTPRDIGLLLAVLAMTSNAQAQSIDDPCTAGKGPGAKDNHIEKETCSFDFGTLDTPSQRKVRNFSDEGRDLKGLAIPTLDADQQDAEANYLTPNHPTPQPDVPLSNWRQYTSVPNDDQVGKILESETRIDIGPGFPLPTMPGAIEPPETIYVTYVRTPPGIFPKLDPWIEPPGTNMLPTLTRPLVNDVGDEIPNTLPSSKQNPYELHDGDPEITRINPLSPIEDLRYVLENLYELFTGRAYASLYEELNDDSVVDTLEKSGAAMTKERVEGRRRLIEHLLDLGTHIVEGKDGPGSLVPSDRAYRGFPLLFHSGHNRVKCVEPVYDGAGNVIGGNVNVHQVWYGGRIQSDTMFLDFGWDYQTVERDGDGDVVYRDEDGNVADDENSGDPSIIYLSAAENGYGGRRCIGGGDPDPIPPNKPWTVTYTVNALHGSRDDFSPTGMFFDCPSKVEVGGTDHFEDDEEKKACPAPSEDLGEGVVRWSKKKLPTGFAMDQTFFPMEDGTRTVFKIKMAPPMYYKLTYTWGWREHPPRAQAMENAHQSIPPHKLKPIVWHEFDTFSDQEATAIAKISDLAPAKRMWRVFGLLDDLLGRIETLPDDPTDDESWQRQTLALLLDGRNAYLDWLDRGKLPSGFRPDENADLTMLFINNTMYGEFARGGQRFHDWRKRIELASVVDDTTSGPAKVPNDNKLRVTLINADYFRHGYVNVDFGGLRGWENQFKPTLKTGGAGSFFTFGRFYHRPNVVPGSISVDPATFELEVGGAEGDVPVKVIPGVHRVMIEYNFEPSRRLRFYQFDPLHHDVAIYSIH